MWYIEYKVPKMTGDTVHRSGPYSGDNVDLNFRDIESYYGVTEIRRMWEAA